MATAVLLPKLGNSVESSIIVRWFKQPGDTIAASEPICEVETDKTTMEVTSPVAGVILSQLFNIGDDIPVQTTIAFVGTADEFMKRDSVAIDSPTLTLQPLVMATPLIDPAPAISPRARGLASREGLDLHGIAGSGPGGRIIERDIQAALATRQRITPVARAMIEKGGFSAPRSGSGADGRVVARDLTPPVAASITEEFERIPLSGVRRVIAERMHASLQQSAQLTLHRGADARQLQAYRKRLKTSPEEFGLQHITIHDLILFVVARTLPAHPELNALLQGETILRYRPIHLGMAVDTVRGLMVPVIHSAEKLSLQQLAEQSNHLAKAAQAGKLTPDQMSGGTFTVTNLGSLGIESFTPILNSPQVAILGVGAITLKPMEEDGNITFIPQLNLSLTIDHQVIDGAPAARFMQQIAQHIANLDLLLAR